jgi:anhydro-N-acetylmuramic acid kinase
MFKDSYKVVGVMSGTSLDGVDLAHIHFTIKEDKWQFEIKENQTISYPPVWVNKLKSAVNFSEAELVKLNEEYTFFLGTIIRSFIVENRLSTLDAVCSHGHTILHQPENGFTLQIGNLPALAQIVQTKIVCDFRVQDVQLGGQGAPLVPVGDRILFHHYDYCLNLGGFSNVSFEDNGCRIAFDISPVNTVLNFYANQLGFDYDDQGKIARSGNINVALLAELNALDYYQKTFPKSLGFEFVKEVILPLLEQNTISTQDKMHTFIEHIAYQTSMALPYKKGKLLVTGGGAYHTFLLERMHYYLPKISFTIPDKTLLEYKEALIFGLLGVLKLRNEVNTLSSVTGALYDHSSGVIYN